MMIILRLVEAAEGHGQHEIMVQQADVRLKPRDHVVDSVHLQPTLAALERHGADDHAVGLLVNDRLVLNYDRIDGAVAEVLIRARSDRC